MEAGHAGLSDLGRFVPPGKVPPVPEWATYTPNRKQNWKIHKRLSDAKNAFYCHAPIALYQFTDGRWREVYQQPGGTPPSHCEECGKRTAMRSLSGSTWDSGTRIWDKRTAGFRMLWCCYVCARRLRK